VSLEKLPVQFLNTGIGFIYRVGKNPVFFKKPSPVGFLGFIGFIGFIGFFGFYWVF
jgi:hypothetical protein